uniref:Uncharacterized protein n=1 Tax=Vitis vinifera TaxID=29760 RepID=F6HG02_VITVI
MVGTHRYNVHLNRCGSFNKIKIFTFFEQFYYTICLL